MVTRSETLQSQVLDVLGQLLRQYMMTRSETLQSQVLDVLGQLLRQLALSLMVSALSMRAPPA